MSLNVSSEHILVHRPSHVLPKPVVALGAFDVSCAQMWSQKWSSEVMSFSRTSCNDSVTLYDLLVHRGPLGLGFSVSGSGFRVACDAREGCGEEGRRAGRLPQDSFFQGGRLPFVSRT